MTPGRESSLGARWDSAPAVLAAGLGLAMLPWLLGDPPRAGAALALLIVIVALQLAEPQKVAAVALALGVGLSPMDALVPFAALPFFSVADGLLVAGVLLLLPSWWGRWSRLDANLVVPASGLVVVGALSALLSPAPIAALVSVASFVVGAFTLPVVYMLWAPGRDGVVLLCWCYVLGNLVNVAAGAFQPANEGGRWIGFSTHVNVLGLCSMLAIAAALILWHLQRTAYGVLALAAAGLCFVGVWMSGSRSALVVTVVVVALYPVLARSIVAALAVAAVALPAAVAVVVLWSEGERSSDNALGRLFGGGSAGGSDLERARVAREAWESFAQHPWFGVGLTGEVEAHNIYLMVAASAGIAGLALFVAVLLAVVRRGWRAPDQRVLLLPALAYIVNGAVGTNLWDRYVWGLVPLIYLCALARRPASPSTLGAQRSGVDRVSEKRP